MSDKPKDIHDYLSCVSPFEKIVQLPQDRLEALAVRALRDGWTPDEVIDALSATRLDIIDETNKPPA